MVRESRDARLTREDGERRVAEAAREEFRKQLPHLLLMLGARIRPFGEAVVKPIGNDGYHVEYRFFDSPEENVSLGLETDEWGVDIVRNKIQELELDAKIREERLVIAREGWASLSPQQQCALIDLGLARRP